MTVCMVTGWICNTSTFCFYHPSFVVSIFLGFPNVNQICWQCFILIYVRSTSPCKINTWWQNSSYYKPHLIMTESQKSSFQPCSCTLLCLPHILFSPSGFHLEFKQVISTVITVEERASIKVCLHASVCVCVSITSVRVTTRGCLSFS